MDIDANIEKRNVYLKTLYKREYRFSEHIERLKAQIHELERASYVPLLGYAKIEEVAMPLFPDRFMGERVQFTMKTIRPIEAVTVFAYRPENFEGTIDITLAVGERKIDRAVGGGLFSLAINLPETSTGSMEVIISANRTQRPPNSKDTRDLSMIIDRIELRHEAETIPFIANS
jgi:hypothetical protein